MTTPIPAPATAAVISVHANAPVYRPGTWTSIFYALMLAILAQPAFALSADGWAGEGNGTDGGTGGTTVTVTATEVAEYKSYVESTARLIIRVDGMLNIGSNSAIKPKSNKTIVGVGTESGIIGTHIINAAAQNIIFKNLTLRTYDMNPTSDTDAISIRGGKNIWINHCTVYNCSDGLIDLSLGADFVTISWCKFYYTENFGHNLVNLVGSNNAHGDTDEGHLNTTFHHNWYGSHCSGRMPMVRFGKVHVYNNYYDAAECNMYIGVAWMSQILLENSYFEDGNRNTAKVWYYYESNGKLNQTGNYFKPPLQWDSGGGEDEVFDPPYSYELDAVNDVKSILTGVNGAGPNGDEGDTDTTDPTVWITSPEDDATVSGTISVNAAALDNVAVVGVQFKLNGSNLGSEDTTAPYGINWDTSTASPGAHVLTAVARDAANNAATSAAVDVTVSASDTIAPTVAITAPESGATVTGIIGVDATASDNVGVSGVQFKLDGANLGAEDTSAPYGISWDTSTASPGGHTLTAVARDAASNTTVSTSVNVTVGSLTTVTEDFEDGNASGWTADGGTWAVVSSGGTNVYRQSDNTAAANRSILAGTDMTDQVVQADVKSISYDGSNRFFGVVARYTDASNYYYLILRSNNTIELKKLAGGSPSNLVTPVSFTVSTGTWYTLKLEVDGTSLKAYINGVLKLEATDSTFSSGEAGLLAFFTAVDFDNVAVTDLNGTADTTAPSISITAPDDEDTVSGAISVTATASDNIGVVGVQFSFDGQNIGAEDTSSPYSVSWDTTTASAGSYVLSALARDAAGNTTVASINVTVADQAAPTVAITSPEDEASVSSTISITATAFDNVGIAGVQFKLDGVNLGAEDTSEPYSIDWDTTTASAGAHTLTAVARDAAGNTTTSAAIDVTVSDQVAPIVAVTSPAPDANVAGTIDITATATDNVAVVGVQFKLDGENLGAEDTSSPYSISWDTSAVSAGSHVITAVARDADSNSTTSAGVTVNVGAFTSVTDDFEDGNANGWTADGGTWAVVTSGSYVYRQSDNTAPANRTVLAGTDWTDQIVQVDAKPVSYDGSNRFFGVVARFVDSSNYYYLILRSNNTIELKKIVGNSPSNLVTPVSFTVATGTSYTLKLEVSGTSLKGYVNGDLKLQATDTTFASGQAGLLTFFTAADFDNVVVTDPNGDTTDPTVSITAPADESTVSGTINVTATAADNIAVAGVQFKLDGVNLGAEDTSSPYSISWNSTTASPGAHTLTAVARDSAGNTTTSSAVDVTTTGVVTSLTLINADTDQPIAGYDPFLSGAELDLSELPTTNLNVRANVSGSVGSVRFALDTNSNYRTENSAPYALAGDNSGDYNAWTPSTGSHTMSATAWSGSGASGNNLGSLPISFTVVP